jgi:hypothetical protein
MKLKLVNIIVAIFASTFGFGQSQIKGHIMGKSSGEGLPFVELVLSHDTNQIKTQTDFDGAFQFESQVPENFKISISYIGYMALDTLITEFDLGEELILFLDHDTSLVFTITLRNKESALADLDKGEVKLFLPGGLLGAPKLSNDSIFQEKYKLQFVFLGCTSWQGDNFEEYNNETFKYLDNKYGKVWRKEIRKDVIGY